MANSSNLHLPFIEAAQAQKHVTHNEALRGLDAIVQLAVLDRDLGTPPVSPSEGDTYLVAAGATGDWAGRDGDIAAFQDGAWAFRAPRTGWRLWVADEAVLLIWDGASWVDGLAGVSDLVADTVGINATADATNRLSLASAAALFNHDGAGHQLKINKNAAGDTASLLFQTGFSGRAEMGLAGDDDFRIKVSPDGSTFHEAITIDRATGGLDFPSGITGGPIAVDLNSGSPPAPPAEDTVAHFAAPSNEQTRVVIDAEGSGGQIMGRRTNGSYAAPTAVQAGQSMFEVTARGYGATGYSSAAGIFMALKAAENWSDSAQGTRFAFFTTEIGSSAVREIIDFNADGSLQTLFGRVRAVRVVTASGDVTVAAGDDIVVVDKSSAGATQVDLPAGPETGRQFVIKDGRGDAAVNNITIVPAAGTIDGAAAHVMTVNHESATVIYTGSEWSVI